MQPFEQLEFGQFYHIYNHGVGGRDLFRKPDNYEYFLSLYDKYISLVAETYAWCLMKNHFHVLVRIKEEEEVDKVIITPDRVSNPVRGRKKELNIPSNQFSKLFNSYAQAFNKYHHSHGALFERPFQRKRVDTKEYLKRMVLYIHYNPMHHGFCEHPLEYPWSSYLTCVSIKPTKLHREAVIGWFDSEANFRTRHNEKFDMDDMDDWLGLK